MKNEDHSVEPILNPDFVDVKKNVLTAKKINNIDLSEDVLTYKVRFENQISEVFSDMYLHWLPFALKFIKQDLHIMYVVISFILFTLFCQVNDEKTFKEAVTIVGDLNVIPGSSNLGDLSIPSDSDLVLLNSNDVQLSTVNIAAR